MKLIAELIWLGGAAWLTSACAQSAERAPARTPSSNEANEAPASGAQAESGAASPSTMYTCPMHPEVQHAGPGECPKCGMKLVPGEKPAPSAQPSAEPVHEHAQ